MAIQAGNRSIVFDGPLHMIEVIDVIGIATWISMTAGAIRPHLGSQGGGFKLGPIGLAPRQISKNEALTPYQQKDSQRGFEKSIHWSGKESRKMGSWDAQNGMAGYY